MHQHLDRLDQRRRYLAERIKAKQTVGWETVYDQSEHDALAWALAQLQPWTPTVDETNSVTVKNCTTVFGGHFTVTGHNPQQGNSTTGD